MKIVDRWLDLPESIRELLSCRRWEFASENHDDDFHTDVLFLRVSCGSMADFAGHASCSVLSYHDGFDARFFYEEQENRGVIARLVERYFVDRRWRESIPAAIRDTAARLDAASSHLRAPEALRHLPLSELRAFYSAQLAAHLELYEPCWTAETLQAAGKGLTEALVRLLLEKKVPRETLFDVFNTLTVPDTASVFGTEQERLLHAAMALAEDPALKATAAAHPARAKLCFDASALRLAREVAASSGVFAYHGFSQRRRASEEDILERLAELVGDDARRERERMLLARREALLHARSRLERELGLGEDEISFFRTYAELGNTKVLRRMAQLHNFEYLDALLRELAIRFDTCEAVFHFMTPEEILDCMDRGCVANEAQYRQRVEAMTFVLHEGEEFLLVGEASRACRDAVIEVPVNAEGRLSGVPVSPGRARGRAVLAVRNDESLRRRFREGDVLVSVETDPDLVPLMRKAAAIVTDQGGITSHAAIIARELGVPCVTGVAGATTIIREGDLLVVDAHRGTVEVVDSATSTGWDRPVHRLGHGVWPETHHTGRKAAVLHRLRQAGHPVPEGFLVPDYVSGKRPAPPALAMAIQEELTHLAASDADDAGGRWAVRSSATCEDGGEHSQAGRFTTRLGVATADVAQAIDELQCERRDRAGGSRGEGEPDFELPVLVMRMVDATVSGVVFTVDPRRPDSGQLIIETTPGLCEALVSGRIRPRCAYASAVGAIGGDGGRLEGETWLTPEQSDRLLGEVSRLQDTLGERALDIEFSFAGERLFVLQARPLSRAQWGGRQ
ncbi:MAG: PEP-utilizing enzyme [Thermoanaerobaculia bacterium]